MLISEASELRSMAERSLLYKNDPYTVVKFSDRLRSRERTKFVRNAGAAAVWEEEFTFKEVCRRTAACN